MPKYERLLGELFPELSRERLEAKRRAASERRREHLRCLSADCDTMMKSLSRQAADLRAARAAINARIRERGKQKLAEFSERATALATSGQISGVEGARLDAELHRLARLVYGR